MPRKANFRQRGKKHKKGDAHEAAPAAHAPSPAPAEAHGDARAAPADGDALPAWMGGAGASSDAAALAANAPFGFVDADLKAYLRTALTSLAALAQPDAADEDDGDVSSLEERRTLRNAALAEIAGRELAIATDPDTSRVLELLVGAMEARQCRVLADKLCGR
jgi:nucleolar protein 9